MRLLKTGCDCMQRVKETYDDWFDSQAHHRELISLYAIRVLFLFAQVQTAQCLLEQALVAGKKIEILPGDHFEVPFYRGKIAATRYYLNNILPMAFKLTDIITNADSSVLQCPEEALIIDH
jgi:hypothetical protein